MWKFDPKPKKKLSYESTNKSPSLPHREVVGNSSNGRDDPQIQFDDYSSLRITDNFPTPANKNKIKRRWGENKKTCLLSELFKFREGCKF